MLSEKRLTSEITLIVQKEVGHTDEDDYRTRLNETISELEALGYDVEVSGEMPAGGLNDGLEQS